MPRALFVVAALLLAAPSTAAPLGHCSSVKQMANVLMMYHREFPIGTMPGRFPSTLELYASDTGTWTVVQIVGNQACIIDAGEEWAVPTAIRGNGA